MDRLEQVRAESVFFYLLCFGFLVLIVMSSSNVPNFTRCRDKREKGKMLLPGATSDFRVLVLA